MEGFSYNKRSVLEKYDSAPTANSTNLVPSGGIKTYVDTADATINAKVDQMIARVGNPFVFKGTVAAIANLPANNNTVNDTYFVTDPGFMYTWNGSSWDKTSTDVNNQLAHDIATDYDETKADYKAGNLVMYNNQVYVRNADATAAEGTFVAANWTATSIGDELYDEVTNLKSAFSPIMDNYPAFSSLQYVSGNITTTGATNTNTAYLRNSTAIGPIYDGDVIINDGTYYFKVAVYNSSTVGASSFVSYITPDGYTTCTNHGRLYSLFAIPPTYAGKYMCICAFKADSSDISSQASTLSDHIKIIRLGKSYKKLGYESTLTSSDDLNNVTEPGVYKFDSNSIPPNVPLGIDSGWVIVESTPNRNTAMQIVLCSQGIMSRINIAGTWSKYYDSLNIDSRRKIASRNLEVLERKLFAAELFRDIELVQGGVNYRTGANYGTTNARCRTGFINVPSEDLIIQFDNPDYAWVCWSYSGTSASNGTHENTTGNYPVCDTPIAVKFVNGDRYIRIAFMRTDGAALTSDLTDPTSDYSIIKAGLHFFQAGDVSGSLNKVNMSSFKGMGSVVVTHNEDESVTASSETSASYQYFRVVGNVDTFIKPNVVYALRAKIIEMDTPVCYFRFRGIVNSPTKLSIGLPAMRGAGEYAAFYRASGFEKHLDFFITGGTGGSGSVTVTDIMLAETDISLPYVPYGVSYDTILPSIGVHADKRSWGLENAMAGAAQYAHVRWTPISNLPSQFSSISNQFDAGQEVVGVPYSSARGVDKLIGPQVSLYTFLTAVRNPRSVLFTRKLTYSNARTYYGTVCSAYIGHAYHQVVNYATADMRLWDQLERIEYVDLQPGDLLLCSWHVQMVTSVYRDQYGRILSVGWAEAGDPVVHYTFPESWGEFSETHINNPDPLDVFYPYRYKKLNAVTYAKELGALGYPDETIEEVVIPDIMSEYGDKAVFREGESTIINVLDGTGYNSIQVYIDGALSQTKSTIEDFTLSNMTPGLYEIKMVGANGQLSECKFFVCDTNCSFNSNTKVLTFSSSNATPVAFYVYTDNSSRPSNKVVNFTEEDIENGYINLSDYLVGDYVNVKMAFAPSDYPDWGVATWYTKTPEAMGLWTTV